MVRLEKSSPVHAQTRRSTECVLRKVSCSLRMLATGKRKQIEAGHGRGTLSVGVLVDGGQ